jgi:C1A family cysteine protease
MKLIVAVALLAVCSLAEALQRKRATTFDDHNIIDITDDADKDYESFLNHYYPDYVPDEKDHQRKANFMECRQKMIDHDPDEEGWATGLTHFCHMTDGEIADQWNHLIGLAGADAAHAHGIRGYDHQMSKRELAKNIDWRWWNGVTKVKNQGSCGSCYTFAAAAALEGAYARYHGELLDLSTQQYVDCSLGYSAGWRWDAANNKYEIADEWTKTGGNGGCDGGWYHACWAYNNMTAKQNGWSCYNYSSGVTLKPGACNPNPSCNVDISVHGYVNIHNEDELADALNWQGPVACALDASAIMSYTGGIVDASKCGTYADHAITVVGYGSENGKDYWIIKNSWGDGWGEKGYFRLPRGVNACGIGSNYCAYPIVN